MHKDYITLSRYRLKTALEDFEAAIVNFNSGHYRAMVNRAYYCIFHSMRSLLILDGKDFKSHTGVRTEFRKSFIKTGIFDVKLSDVVRDISIMRGESDYGDMVSISKEEAERLLNDAELFYNCVKPYVEGKIITNIDTINEIN